MRRVPPHLLPIFLYLTLSSSLATAATFYVDGSLTGDCSGSSNNAYNPSARNCNADDGTIAYNTIAEGEDAAISPGDIVYVREGTYNERVSCGHSGSAAGGFITFAAYPGEEAMIAGNHRNSGTVVMRGFNVNNQSYLRFVGFEITHTNTSYRFAIQFSGTNHHIEFLDNYVHHTYGEGGIIRAYNSTVSYFTARGNEVYYASCIQPGGNCQGNGWFAGSDGGPRAHHWLLEYNHVHRCGDFINLYGDYHIVQNNYLHDYANSYFSGGGGHVDFFQPGSDGMDLSVNFHVYEANFTGDNAESDSHVLQMRDTVNSGDSDVIYRWNVAYNLGSYALQAGGVDRVRHYNNTFYDILNYWPSGMAIFWYNTEGGNPSTGNHHFNNLVHTVPTGHDFLGSSGGSNVVASDNLCYRTASHASCDSTADPRFANSGSHDFTLQSSSAARNLGKPITLVNDSGGGSGTTLVVDEGGFFVDGYDMVPGDRIIIGDQAPVRITNVSGNTLTLAQSRSWNDNDAVVFIQNISAVTPDVGAYPYRSGGYDFTVTYAVNGDTVTATPSDASLVRKVIVYEDNIPVGVDHDPPFQVSGVGGGTITVRAYPLYATPRLYVEPASGEPPAAPTNLRILP